MIVIDRDLAERLVNVALSAAMGVIAKEFGVVPDEIFRNAREAGVRDALALIDATASIASRWIGPTDAEIRAQNLISHLEFEAIKIATDEQRVAFRDGRMAEDELVKIARDELFKGFGDLPRWQALSWKDALHEAACTHIANVSYGVEEMGLAEKVVVAQSKAAHTLYETVEALASHPWVTATIRATGTPATQLDYRRHWVRCEGCKRTVSRNSGLVTVQWAGRRLSREYAL